MKVDDFYNPETYDPDTFDPTVTFFTSENTAVKRMEGKAGNGVAMHVHPTKPHLSILAKGEARVFRDSGYTNHVAGDCIEILAGEKHGILFLTDCVWFCINAE